jgi:hypothetical protein
MNSSTIEGSSVFDAMTVESDQGETQDYVQEQAFQINLGKAFRRQEVVD